MPSPMSFGTILKIISSIWPNSIIREMSCPPPTIQISLVESFFSSSKEFASKLFNKWVFGLEMASSLF